MSTFVRGDNAESLFPQGKQRRDHASKQGSDGLPHLESSECNVPYYNLGTAHSPEPWETNPGCLRYFRCLWFTVEACMYNMCLLLIFPSFISFIKDLIKIILINTIFYIAAIVISLSSDNGIRAQKTHFTSQSNSRCRTTDCLVIQFGGDCLHT